MVKKSYLFFVIFFLSGIIITAQSALSVEKIMRDPSWMGSFPDNPRWSEDSRYIYFERNPENKPYNSVYKYDVESGETIQITIDEEKNLPPRSGVYNQDKTIKVFTKAGDLYLMYMENFSIRSLTNTLEHESNPQFNANGDKVYFTNSGNLYSLDLNNLLLTQVTDIKSGNEKSDPKENEHKKWLIDQQEDLISTIVRKNENGEIRKGHRELFDEQKPATIYTGSFFVSELTISPDEKYVTVVMYKSPSGEKRTIIPNYITESGFTDSDNAYSKVGDEQYEYKTGIYDVIRDTFYYCDLTTIEGIFDKPEYLFDYNPDQDKKYENPRDVIVHAPYWSDDSKYAVSVVRAQDNKDRWILKFYPATGKFETLDRQRDTAWIDGPGITHKWSSGDVGFLPDNEHFYYQSEATGYSHLFIVNVNTGEKTQLTSGEFEVFDPQISRDGNYWYFTSSEVSPFERHLYKMPLFGGERRQLTFMTGNNRVYLSPDEEKMAILYSYSNKPWELYYSVPATKYKPKPITNSVSGEFTSYNWRIPEIVKFQAEDGTKVPARLYTPDAKSKNGAAVIFVHGAGYLQNVHNWWSHYFREYMFHNLLTDLGYTVLDIDYRGSKGYGRDWRTAIYRFMGGKDLSDQVDGAKFLISDYNINPEKIGIYGGSYGGFITLKALFKHPNIFRAGAALRSVTDWAHYHHGYTSNILNTPVSDSLAFVRSSPIYDAEGFEGHLLMCHGMIDDNVHFQDIIRLTQRLIELGKVNWELAVYPMERHAFTEPESWTDEYKRILKLFENTIGR